MDGGGVSVRDIVAAFNGSGAVLLVVPFVLAGKLAFNPGAEADDERAAAPGVNDR